MVNSKNTPFKSLKTMVDEINEINSYFDNGGKNDSEKDAKRSELICHLQDYFGTSNRDDLATIYIKNRIAYQEIYEVAYQQKTFRDHLSFILPEMLYQLQNEKTIEEQAKEIDKLKIDISELKDELNHANDVILLRDQELEAKTQKINKSLETRFELHNEIGRLNKEVEDLNLENKGLAFEITVLKAENYDLIKQIGK